MLIVAWLTLSSVWASEKPPLRATIMNTCNSLRSTLLMEGAAMDRINTLIKANVIIITLKCH